MAISTKLFGSACKALLALSLLSMTFACGDEDGNGADDPDDPDGLTGSFTIEGNTYACDVTTQLFPATGEFSVLCQNDDIGLVQTTFKDEASARTAQSLTIIESLFSSHEDPASIDVSYFELGVGINGASRNDSPGTGSVAASGATNVLTLGGVLLENSTTDATITISAAVINF